MSRNFKGEFASVLPWAHRLLGVYGLAVVSWMAVHTAMNAAYVTGYMGVDLMTMVFPGLV
jgi:hypothetical protein